MSRTNPPEPGPGSRWLIITSLGLALVVVGLTRSAFVQFQNGTPSPPSAAIAPAHEPERSHSAFWSLSNPRHHSTPAERAAVSPRVASLRNDLARAMTESNPLLKTAAMESLAAGVADGEIPQILKALTIHELGTEFASLLVRRSAGVDPAGTAGWISMLPSGPERNEMMSQLAVIWAGSDPAAATAWLERLPEDPARTSVAMVLAAELARTDQPSALTIASALPPSDQRDTLIAHTVSEWAVTDPAATATWIGQIENQPLHDRLVGALAAATAKTDGAGAANLIASEMRPGQSQDQAAMSVVLRWVQTDPEKTTEWVHQFPEGPLRQTALESLANLSRVRSPVFPAP